MRSPCVHPCVQYESKRWRAAAAAAVGEVVVSCHVKPSVSLDSSAIASLFIHSAAELGVAKSREQRAQSSPYGTAATTSLQYRCPLVPALRHRGRLSPYRMIAPHPAQPSLPFRLNAFYQRARAASSLPHSLICNHRTHSHIHTLPTKLLGGPRPGTYLHQERGKATDKGFLFHRRKERGIRSV